VHDTARVKRIRVERDVDREPLVVCTIFCIGSLAVRAIRSKPLASMWDTLLNGQSFTDHNYAQR
jgi:hypothetical protein